MSNAGLVMDGDGDIRAPLYSPAKMQHMRVELASEMIGLIHRDLPTEAPVLIRQLLRIAAESLHALQTSLEP